MEKMAETRIRTKKEAGVKVNKGLAEKILRDQEKAKYKAEKKAKRKNAASDATEVEGHGESDEESRPTILSDPRFSKVFEDPAFAIDEASREYALLNPSSVAHAGSSRGKTVVEEEEESAVSDDDSMEGSDSETDGASSDSSAEGGTFVLFFIFCSILVP